MRLLLSIMLFAAFAANAQTTKPSTFTRLKDVQLKDSIVQKKWFISKYSGMSAGIMAFKGGSASYLAAPMGVQLNRMITDNTYAFAGVEIAPAYINFNQRFMNGGFDKSGFTNSFMAGNRSQFTINPNAYIGIGYTNDERTFQIQGRLGISNSNANYFTDPSGFRQTMHLNNLMQSANGNFDSRPWYLRR